MASTGADLRQSGFTLLETLIVVVLVGLLMVGLTQGVKTGLALWGAQQRRLAATADLDAGARVLRNLLTGLAASPASAAGANPTAVKGDSDHFSFVGDLPTGLGTTQRADISIELRKKKLMLIWTPHRHEILLGPPPKPTETELVADVARLGIAYWGATAPDQPAAWQARWDGPAPPSLVRIRVAFGKGDRRHWPDLIAAPVL